MEAKEAIRRIMAHKFVHFRAEERAIKITEALDLAVKALEKQVPKKPLYSDYDDNGDGKIIPYKAKCPVCGYEFEFGYWNDEDNHHCICGQRMDWERGGMVMDDLDICYECSGYGDNYDENGKLRCPRCPVNKDNDCDWDYESDDDEEFDD